MFADLLHEITGRGAGVVFGLVLGGVGGWFYGHWKRYKQKQSILKGDARDTIVIHHHIVETGPGPDGGVAPKTLRLRSLGQSQLERVVPNGHLAGELLRRAQRVTANDTLISMEGAEGSYLLETLTNFVCDRVANCPFEHELYVMAPCCEPAALAQHQPIAILLIAAKDLVLFEKWTNVREIQVEHGGDGARILTLLEMAKRFRREQDKIAALRKAGQRTQFIETMYVLDLALDKRTASVPLKDVPWGRFEHILKSMNVE